MNLTIIMIIEARKYLFCELLIVVDARHTRPASALMTQTRVHNLDEGSETRGVNAIELNEQKILGNL